MIEIPLTQYRIATIDDEDWGIVGALSWYWKPPSRGSGTGYAAHKDRGSPAILMHRLILGLGRNDLGVDHKDGDGLNNCRSNLRLATSAQNNHNTRKYTSKYSQYKGVSWDGSRKPWVASISTNGRSRTIGRFDTEIEAAQAYNERAIAQWGEFAWTNDLPPTVDADK